MVRVQSYYTKLGLLHIFTTLIWSNIKISKSYKLLSEPESDQMLNNSTAKDKSNKPSHHKAKQAKVHKNEKTKGIFTNCMLSIIELNIHFQWL